MTVQGFFRAAIVCAAALTWAGPADAQSQSAQSDSKSAPRVEYVQIVSSGFGGPGEPVKRGKFREKFFNRTLLRTGVAVGTTFTMTVRPVGQPDGAEVALRFVWRTPRPIGKDSKTGKAIREISEDVTAKLGQEISKTFEFRNEEQVVKGTWRAEVWNGNRKIATRRFAIR